MALIVKSTMQPWDQSSINGIRYPGNIETLWSTAELAAIGLVRALPFAAPAGQSAVGSPTYVLNADGTCSETYQTQPIIQAWKPFRIIEALRALDPQKAQALLSGADAMTLARFYTADEISETSPELLAALKSIGFTIDDLKSKIS